MRAVMQHTSRDALGCRIPLVLPLLPLLLPLLPLLLLCQGVATGGAVAGSRGVWGSGLTLQSKASCVQGK